MGLFTGLGEGHGLTMAAQGHPGAGGQHVIPCRVQGPAAQQHHGPLVVGKTAGKTLKRLRKNQPFPSHRQAFGPCLKDFIQHLSISACQGVRG